MATIYKLKPGHVLTVTNAGGTVHVKQVQDATVGGFVTTSTAFGPYALERDFNIWGDHTAAITESDLTANIPSVAQAAMLDAIPAADQDDSATIWNDAGVLKVSTAP